MANVVNAVELESERLDVNVWFRLNIRPRVPSLDEGGSVDGAVVVATVVAVVTATVVFAAVVLAVEAVVTATVVFAAVALAVEAVVTVTVVVTVEAVVDAAGPGIKNSQSQKVYHETSI